MLRVGRVSAAKARYIAANSLALTIRDAFQYTLIEVDADPPTETYAYPCEEWEQPHSHWRTAGSTSTGPTALSRKLGGEALDPEIQADQEKLPLPSSVFVESDLAKRTISASYRSPLVTLTPRWRVV